MKKYIVLPGLALVGGLAGAVLRWRQFSSAFQPELGLFLHGAPATYALVGLSALLILALLVSLRGLSHGPDDFLPAFGCPLAGQMTVLTAAGLLFLAAAVLGAREGLTQLALWRSSADPDQYLLPYPFSLLLCSALSVPSGLAVLLLGRAAYRGELTDAACRLAPFPACTGLAWLFVTHLAHGTEPVLMRYVFSLAAAGLLMLSQYYCAGFLFGRPFRRRALFCSLAGTAAGLTSLSDRSGLFITVLTMAYVLTALAQSFALLRNCSGLPQPPRMPSGAQDMDDDDTASAE